MVTLGPAETRVLEDDWTVVTTDGSPGGALGEHRRGHRRRALGADRPRRRQGTAGGRRRGIRPAVAEPRRRPGGSEHDFVLRRSWRRLICRCATSRAVFVCAPQPGVPRRQIVEDMAKKDGVIEIEGTIVEALPNAMFRVELHERSQGSRSHLGQDAPALHPDPPRGPRGGGAQPVRPDPWPDRLPLPLSTHQHQTCRRPPAVPDRRSRGYEGPAERQEDLRQVQGDPPSRPGHGDLREPAPQAAPGLTSTT